METKKRLSREQKREKAVVDLINQMFIIAGHSVTYDDIVGVENWFQKYTMTVEQGDEFKKWGKKYLMKELRESAKSAEREMQWFSLQWGLTYSNFNSLTEEIKSLPIQERSYSEEDMFEFSQWISHNDWVYLPSKKYWVNEEQEELEQKLSSKEILNLWFEQFKKK
tara:strand:- start:8032 stop:8529 length:498 start_codon:yes stop_codon:yes gene_type:complete